ncbi:mediator of RNA polymerase II transcription subunit 19-B isoform X2 [Latimeria chalumnae]|uniref:mediator of RNA polymerase II transcription subunit 19-B isoform X2 n=1 Tax=Latimeria chalumnae TaxID=7897 RepID=UPI00313C6082
MENFSSLFGQAEPPPPPASSLGFGAGKPPGPVSVPPPDDGSRKLSALHEPFYLLRELPGMIDLPGAQDNSCLRLLIEKPPICGNSFNPLTGTLLTGFRLHAGPLPEQYRLMHIHPPKKKNKHKHRQNRTLDPVPPETPSDSDHKKKKKKKEDDPERKKKKKDKKKKKNRHSPDHPGISGSSCSLR